eukprot:536628_1
MHMFQHPLKKTAIFVVLHTNHSQTDILHTEYKTKQQCNIKYDNESMESNVSVAIMKRDTQYNWKITKTNSPIKIWKDACMGYIWIYQQDRVAFNSSKPQLPYFSTQEMPFILKKQILQHSIGSTMHQIIELAQHDRNKMMKHKRDIYSIPMDDKNDIHILSSLVFWAATVNCEKLLCNNKIKLECHCSFESFIHKITSALKNTSDDLLVLKLITFFGQMRHMKNDDNVFAKYITEWMKFELFNFVCWYCNG